MRKEELAELVALAGLVAKRDLGELSDLRSRSEALAREAAALAAKAAAPSPEGFDPALRAGVDLLWNRWKDERMRRMQHERAVLAAAEAEARARARRSFGRQVALAELSGKPL